MNWNTNWNLVCISSEFESVSIDKYIVINTTTALILICILQ